MLLFYPLAVEPREVALARIALVQFVPPRDGVPARAARPDMAGCMTAD